MSQPVWTLSVDLQAKTAVFQSGLADAAKAARGSFSEVKTGAGEMSRETGYSMMEARHSVMMLGEEFGIRLPRSLSMFIAGLGPIGPALEAAFPFLALIGLAALFIEHLVKMREAGEKLTADQAALGLAIQKAFTSLDDKLIQAQIRADELRKDHLGALQLQLELIDHQSMSELAHQFDEVAKHALECFKDIESHWYTFGNGSEGAKNALQEFQREYDALLAKGTKEGDEEASGLLRGTLGQARKTLDMMNQLHASQTGDGQKGNYGKYEEAKQFLEQQKLLSKITQDYTSDEYKAQQGLVQALQAQVDIQEKIARLKGMEKQNATTSTHQTMDKEAEDRAKQQTEALDKGRRDVVRLIAEQYRQEVSDTQAGEREIIEATKQGGQERLNAIDAAIMEENALGLQQTQFYRGLWQERIQRVRQMSEDESRERQSAAMEDTAHAQKMAELELAADRSAFQMMRQNRRMSVDEVLQDELEFANREFAIKMQTYARELAALDKNGKDYELRVKQVQDRIAELTQQHENQVTEIKRNAEDQRTASLRNGLDREREEVSRGLTDAILRHQTWAQMVSSLGNQVASNMMQNAIQEAMALDFSREKQAAQAAREGFLTGLKMPFPINMVMAPVLGAAYFAAIMAFEGGTDSVPGDPRRGDVVPAMLKPGEGVVPGGVMDNLRTMARNGGFDQRPQTHVTMQVHMNASALDTDGVDTVFSKHADKIQRHFENTLRKLNR